jgi:hypothetical protein
VESGGHRGDHEHVAAPLDHVRQARAHGPPHAEQVDLDGSLEGHRVGRAHHAHRRDPGVGHHYVDSTEALDRAGHGALQRLGVGHVALEPGGVRAALRRHALELLGLEPHERDIRPARGHPPRRLGPEAAGRARDQHRLATRGPLHATEP